MATSDRKESKGWRGESALWHTHPIVENKRKRQGSVVEIEEDDQPHLVNTLGGRMHVRWDEGASATPRGQLVFFAEFLATTGIFDHWGGRRARWPAAAATHRTSATCSAR